MSAADGSVSVIVREAVPVSKDSRLKVDLARNEPVHSKDERWEQDREESGIYTWELSVPANESADLVYSVEISYPTELQITGW